MEAVRWVRSYLTLNGLVVRADILYGLSERDEGLVSMTADHYFVAALYADAISPPRQVREYIARLERRVSSDYNPWQQYGALRDRAAHPLSPHRDERQIQKAVSRFETSYPLFPIDAFVGTYLPSFSSSSSSVHLADVIPFQGVIIPFQRVRR